MIFISFLYLNASKSRILEPSPQGLISSYKYKFLALFKVWTYKKYLTHLWVSQTIVTKQLLHTLHKNVFFVTVFSVLLLGLQQGHKWVNWMKRKKSLLHKQHVWGFFKVKRRAKNLKHFSSDRQKPLKRSTFFFCLIAIHT